MKLWELFKDEYEGRIVKYKNREGECRTCRISKTKDGKINLFRINSNNPLLFSQSEMQDYDFEFNREPLTFNELTKVDVYGKTIEVEIGNHCHIGTFSDILENFSREKSSDDCMKLFTEGKWYIMLRKNKGVNKMEYISAEEFLKQSDKVQREFKEYFDCETMLFYSNGQLIYGEFKDILINTPAVTEGQLRKFIEDKVGGKTDVIWEEESKYTIAITDGTGFYCKVFDTTETNLLKAYWKVACEITSNVGEF